MTEESPSDKGFLDKAKEAAGTAAEKAKPALDKAGAAAGGLLSKAMGMFKKGDDAGDTSA